MSSSGLKRGKRNTQIYDDETQVVLHYNKTNGFVENADFSLLAAVMKQIGRKRLQSRTRMQTHRDFTF